MSHAARLALLERTDSELPLVIQTDMLSLNRSTA
jgi:hypothetical protein